MKRIICLKIEINDRLKPLRLTNKITKLNEKENQSTIPYTRIIHYVIKYCRRDYTDGVITTSLDVFVPKSHFKLIKRIQ